MSETQTETKTAKAKATKKKENDVSLGSLLKSYREKNGHDMYEVAEALCLSPEIVNALEKEDFASLPEPPYIRGYLRSYAKFADTDPQEIIELYEAQRGASPQDLEYHFKPNTNNLTKPVISPATLKLGLIALLLVVLASLSMIPSVNGWISETWSGFSKQMDEKNNEDTADELVAATDKFKIPPLPISKDPQQPSTTKKDSENLADNNPAVDATGKKIESQSEDNTANTVANKENIDKENTEKTKNASSQIDNNTEGTKLRFVFNKEVWMRIKDKDKKTVFESLSPAGDEKEIRLKKPMTFRIGNAQGIEIYVEGKRLDISAVTQGSVANFAIE